MANSYLTGESIQHVEDVPEVSQGEIPPPVGTTFLLILYIFLLSGMWGFMYLGLIGR